MFSRISLLCEINQPVNLHSTLNTYISAYGLPSETAPLNIKFHSVFQFIFLSHFYFLLFIFSLLAVSEVDPSVLWNSVIWEFSFFWVKTWDTFTSSLPAPLTPIHSHTYKWSYRTKDLQRKVLNLNSNTCGSVQEKGSMEKVRYISLIHGFCHNTHKSKCL